MTKEYPTIIGLADIWHHYENFPLAQVATIDGNQPRVRSMALITHKDRLWISSKTTWNKVTQIRANNRVEFTVQPRGNKSVGSIRTTCRATEIDDLETKKELAAIIPWFASYWESFDYPSFTLLRLDPKMILVDSPDRSAKCTVHLEDVE
ncbi:MAG: pyridoxamine 5'-phosphate oxidase family protein [Candidatus Thorarchaeota archaeon]